jgi:ABC-type Fe2+-enterobactin transport system substrate-binding protein
MARVCWAGAGGYRHPRPWGSRRELVELKGLDTTPDDFFGSSVAISGSTIIVGSPGVASDTGRAYVFTKTAGSWRQVSELRGRDGSPDDLFGSSVAISGTTIIVGSPSVASGAGGAYVFTKTAGSWHQVAELRGPGTAAGDGFGSSVAISGDTIVVGAPDHANGSGRAYVFAESRTGWGHAAQLKGRDTCHGRW